MATPSEPRRTAFICAMPMELRPLARKLSLHRTQIGGVSVSSGTLDGREVVAIVTGMGPKLASEATTRLLDAVSVDRVIVVGITGALENVTPIGTLVRPEAVVDGATGAEHPPEPLGAGAAHGKMWTTDPPTTDPDVLGRLPAPGAVSP